MSEKEPFSPPQGLISIEDAIDEIARKALEEAQRREQAQKLLEQAQNQTAPQK